jgi:hypothetical protein
MYDEYVAPLARTFFVTRGKLMRNPAYLESETRAYLAMVKAGKLPPMYYEKFFYFMNPSFIEMDGDENYLSRNGFDGGWDGNVVKTCVAFWIRRTIDGTAQEFNEGLESLLRAYDGDFLLHGAPELHDFERDAIGH